MGVERAVTRWYLLRQSLLTEIAQLEARLALVEQEDGPTSGPEQPVKPEAVEVSLQLTRTRERLKHLGPCPKPMMG